RGDRGRAEALASGGQPGIHVLCARGVTRRDLFFVVLARVHVRVLALELPPLHWVRMGRALYAMPVGSSALSITCAVAHGIDAGERAAPGNPEVSTQCPDTLANGCPTWSWRPGAWARAVVDAPRGGERLRRAASARA